MKRSFTLIIISLVALCAAAQDLYIGSFYVTSTDEESQYGDGKDKWSVRKPIICEMFRYEKPDILGLQGATSSQMSTIRTGLNTGMQGLLSYKLAGNILYNNTCELDTCNSVEGFPEGCSCSWAKLRKEEKDFYVFNICFTPDDAYTSANRLRTTITEINTENLPCFIVGSLGTKEATQAYNRITARYNDAYAKAPIISAEYGTVNNFDLENNHSSDRFDFVFTPKTGVTIKAYGQMQNGYYTSESDGYKRRLPSTHFPVMVKLKM